MDSRLGENNKQYIEIYKKDLTIGFAAIIFAVLIATVAFIVKSPFIFYIVLGCAAIAAYGIVKLAVAITRKIYKSAEPAWIVMTYNSTPRSGFLVALIFGIPSIIRLLFVNWLKKNNNPRQFIHFAFLGYKTI